jgi:hypothetical protein
MGRFAAYRPLRHLNSPIATRTDDITNLVKDLRFRANHPYAVWAYKDPYNYVPMNVCALFPVRVAHG